MMLTGILSFLFFLMLGLSRVRRAKDKGKFKLIHFQFHLYQEKNYNEIQLSSTRVSYSMADEKRYGKHEKQGKFHYQN